MTCDNNRLVVLVAYNIGFTVKPNSSADDSLVVALSGVDVSKMSGRIFGNKNSQGQCCENGQVVPYINKTGHVAYGESAITQYTV